MDFSATNMKYLDYDYKTSLKTKKQYHIYTFQHQKTKRLYYIYDWATPPLIQTLEKNKSYTITGNVNSLNSNIFLILKTTQKEEE